MNYAAHARNQTDQLIHVTNHVQVMLSVIYHMEVQIWKYGTKETESFFLQSSVTQEAKMPPISYLFKPYQKTIKTMPSNTKLQLVTFYL